MFAKLFRGCREESSRSSSHKLKQTLEVLEKKETILQKKISMEVERAKEFTKAKNKEAALQCLKRKKFYEGQIEQLGSFQSRIHDQEQKLQQKSPLHSREMQQRTSKTMNNHEKCNIG